MYAGQITVAHDTGFGMDCLQPFQQREQRLLLCLGTGVGFHALGIEAALVAHAQRVTVIACGMGAHQLFVARLIGMSVAGDIIVIARKAKAVGMVTNQCLHAVRAVTA